MEWWRSISRDRATKLPSANFRKSYNISTPSLIPATEGTSEDGRRPAKPTHMPNSIVNLTNLTSTPSFRPQSTLCAHDGTMTTGKRSTTVSTTCFEPQACRSRAPIPSIDRAHETNIVNCKTVQSLGSDNSRLQESLRAITAKYQSRIRGRSDDVQRTKSVGE